VTVRHDSIDTIALARPMDTADDVRAFLRDCLAVLGGGFHPDTRGAEYRVSGTNLRTFQADASAAAFDCLMGQAFHAADRHGLDLYALTVELAGTCEVCRRPIDPSEAGLCDSCDQQRRYDIASTEVDE
jgi:hypothetical protein